MWLYKLIFLLALIASWIPWDSQSASPESDTSVNSTIMLDFESEEEQEEEESEELAA